MAYRKLEDGDLVRIVDRNLFHGRNAIVIDSELHKDYTRVQVERRGDDPVECANIQTKKLLVRDDPYRFIVDGRVDQKAKAAFEEHKRLTYRERPQYPLEDEELEEACGDCDCCKWHNQNY